MDIRRKANEYCSDKRAAGQPLGSAWLAFPAMIFVFLAAFGTRVYRIASQSYWYDEGVSVVMAQRDPIAIAVNAAADIHPPLYYYFLRIWAEFVGTDEFGLRWLSLAFGLLTVAMVFKLGQKLFDWQTGIAASSFAAVATFQIYYSQEARMYMQVTFLGSLSMYLFLSIQSFDLRWTGSPERKARVVAYVLTSIALLYSHYFAFSILAIQNIWIAFRSFNSRDLRSTAKNLTTWILLQLIIVCAFAPWLLLSFSQLGGWPSISEPFGLDTLLYRVFRVFTFGLSWDAAATMRREALFLALLAGAALAPLIARVRASNLDPHLTRSQVVQPVKGGLEAAGTRRALWLTTWPSLILPLLYFLVPVLVMYFLSLRKPMYNPKFLLLATPGYYLLLGIGLVTLGRIASILMRSIPILPAFVRYAFGVAVVVALLFAANFAIGKSTLAYYFDPKYARDDYRGMVRLIEAQAEDDDAIILNAPGQSEIFGHYFKGAQKVYPLPSDRPMDKQKTETALKGITKTHKRVWLVLWAQAESDPDGFVERWLDSNSFKASNTWFGSVRLVRYLIAGGGVGWQEESDAIFGDTICLKSIRIGSTLAQPGDILDVTLLWQAIKPIQERYTVFLHVIDGKDYLWGQRDSEPGGGNRPTTVWKPAEIVEDRHGLPVLLGTPPGRYQIEVGLYEQDSGRRLTIKNREGREIGDRLLFGQIDVSGSPSFRPEALTIQNRATLSFGSLRFLGFDYHKLGHSVTNTDFRTSDIALATLYWQGTGDISQDYLVEVEVVAKGGVVKLRSAEQPGGENYPTSAWNAGGLVRDQRKLSLADMEAGEYSLRMRVLAKDSKMPIAPEEGNVGSDRAFELTKFRVR